jgi:hypothetical protein
MAKVRSIANPHQEGKHVTLAQARSVFRELSRDSKKEFVTRASSHRAGSKAKSSPKA